MHAIAADVDEVHEAGIRFGVTDDALDEPVGELFEGTLLREEGRDFVELCEMAVLFFNRDGLFRDLLLEVRVEVFEAIGHVIEAARDAPDFIFAAHVDARFEVPARKTLDPFAQALDRPDHPTEQQEHDRKEAPDRKDDQEDLEIAQLPEVALAVVVDLRDEARNVRRVAFDELHGHGAAEFSRFPHDGHDHGAPSGFQLFETLANIGIFGNGERQPRVARLEKFVLTVRDAKLLREGRVVVRGLRDESRAEGVVTQLARRRFRSGARFELPVEHHRVRNRRDDEAHPQERKQKQSGRETLEVENPVLAQRFGRRLRRGADRVRVGVRHVRYR